MEFIKIAKKVGNSSGVLLPKYLLGSLVKIMVLERKIDVKKEALKLLDSNLLDILGIYVTNKNPVEILAISGNIKKIIKNERIKISIVPLSIIKKDIKNQVLRAKLAKAEIILNQLLLSELLKKSSSS